MKKSIQLSLMFVLLTLLAACAVAPAPNSASEETAADSETRASADSVALAEPDLVDLPAPNPPTVEVIEVTDTCRLIRHFYGETCVPLDAQKIVSMDPGTITDNLLMLDRRPIGSMVYAPLEQGPDVAFPPALTGLVEGIDSIGVWPGNIEKVAILQPDLIIGYNYNFEDTYDEYSQIAPTVALGDPNDWRSYLIDTARIVGEEEKAGQIIQQFYADAAALDEQLPDITATLLRPRTETLQVYGTGSEASRILNALGISLTSVPESAFDLWEGEDEAGQLSYETLPDIEGDAFFVISYNLTPEEMVDLQESALWQSHPAVQNEMSFNVEGTAWTNHGPNGVYRVMEEVEAALAGSTMSEAATLDCEASFRTIDSFFGPTCIPEAPERIIALNEGVMVNMLSLGVTPVGVHDWANRDYAQYLEDTTDIVASVSTPDGPNFEAMAALQPDLILGFDFDADEETIETLEQIAPVALSTFDYTNWGDNFRYIGDAVGKLAEAEELIETTNARLDEFRNTYEAGDETIAIIRSRADTFNIYNKESFIAELVKNAGLQMPESFDEIEAWNSMSLEAIPTLTSDKLFVMVRNERESGMFADMNSSALWQTLPAAQNDEVYLVNWTVWVAGWNIVGTNLVIDDLFFFMVGEESPTPNPFADIIIPEYGPQFDEERLELE